MNYVPTQASIALITIGFLIQGSLAIAQTYVAGNLESDITGARPRDNQSARAMRRPLSGKISADEAATKSEHRLITKRLKGSADKGEPTIPLEQQHAKTQDQHENTQSNQPVLRRRAAINDNNVNESNGNNNQRGLNEVGGVNERNGDNNQSGSNN